MTPENMAVFILDTLGGHPEEGDDPKDIEEWCESLGFVSDQIRKAEAAAFKRGQYVMRERIAHYVGTTHPEIEAEIRALTVEEEGA